MIHNKTLNFIHISKTGGTSVEFAANKKGIKWGKFACETIWNSLLSYIDWDIEPHSSHHIPISFCKNEELKRKLLNKYIFFTVVRNPYERCLSEYFCPHNKLIEIPTVENLNNFVQYKINLLDNKKNFQGHFIQQYHYVFDQNKKYTNIILKYENLVNDFNSMSKNFNLNFKLKEYLNKSKKQLSIDSFNNKTINLIQKKYEYDFLYFDYKFDLIKNNYSQLKYFL
jgi:hypothetical protein